MTYSPDPAAGTGDPRRGPRRYGPSAQPAPPRPAPPRPAPAPRPDEPYLGGLDPDDEFLRHVAPRSAPRPATARPYTDRPYTDRPPAGRAQGDRPQGNRPVTGTARPAARPAGPAARGPVPRPDSPHPTRAMPVVPDQGRAWSEVDQPTYAMNQPPTYAHRGGGHTPPPPRPPVPPRTGGPGGGEPPERRRTPGGIVAGRIVAAVLAVAVVLVAGVGYYVRSDVNSASAVSGAAADAGDVGVEHTGGMNILLVGSDSRTDAQGNPLSAEELAALNTEDTPGTNTDTIMVLHIPDGGGKATAVSLPRDTWMSEDVVAGIPGPYSDGSTGDYKPNKINSFYGTAKAYTEEYLASQGEGATPERERLSNEAGRLMLTKVVQKFTGMKIDHYAEVNLLGFYLLSEAIGGVPVCLNNAVDDPFSGAKFPAGEQEISGSAALAFVRQRHGLPEGDLDRVKRQQVFLGAAANKVLSAGTLSNPAKVSGLIDTVKRSVVFDKGFDLFDFAEQMRNLSSGNVTFTTIPITGPETSSGTDALATDPQQIAAFFAALDSDDQPIGTTGSTGTSAAASSSTSGAQIDPSLYVVDAQNATGLPGVAGSALDTVVQAGFVRGDAADYDGPAQSTTSIRYSDGDEAAAAAVQAALGAGTLVQDDGVDQGTILVIVGTDLSGSGLHGAAGALQQGAVHGPFAAAPETSGTEEIVAGRPGCIN